MNTQALAARSFYPTFSSCLGMNSSHSFCILGTSFKHPVQVISGHIFDKASQVEQGADEGSSFQELVIMQVLLSYHLTLSHNPGIISGSTAHS